jgi:type II secretory pathway component PulM
VGRLRTWFAAKSPRERGVFIAIAVLVVCALYALFVQTALEARRQLRPRIEALRAQALAMEDQAVEYQHLHALPAPAASSSDLRSLVQGQTEAAGLASALTRLEPVGAGQVQFAFGAVSFAEWLGWQRRLLVQHVRLDASHIEALSTPGLVSVTGLLVRSGAQ